MKMYLEHKFQRNATKIVCILQAPDEMVSREKHSLSNRNLLTTMFRIDPIPSRPSYIFTFQHARGPTSEKIPTAILPRRASWSSFFTWPRCRLSLPSSVVMNDRGNSIAPNLCFPFLLFCFFFVVAPKRLPRRKAADSIVPAGFPLLFDSNGLPRHGTSSSSSSGARSKMCEEPQVEIGKDFKTGSKISMGRRFRSVSSFVSSRFTLECVRRRRRRHRRGMSAVDLAS